MMPMMFVLSASIAACCCWLAVNMATLSTQLAGQDHSYAEKNPRSQQILLWSCPSVPPSLHRHQLPVFIAPFHQPPPSDTLE